MYSKSIHWFLLISILVASVFIEQDVYAQGGGGEGGAIGREKASFSDAVSVGSLKSYRVWSLRGGYVTSGAGMRNLGRGNVIIKGIPTGSTVVAAFLYWNILSPRLLAAYPKGKFNGQNIAGELIGTTASPCWGTSTWRSRSFRANVTSLVSGNGTYHLTGFASGRTDGTEPSVSDPGPYLEGASLVIIYSKSKYPMTKILLYDGAVETDWSRGTVNTIMGPLPAYNSFLAYTSYIGADGQNVFNEEGSFFNGQPISAADWDGTDRIVKPSPYTDGSLWDTEKSSAAISSARGISVGSLIPAGSTTVTVTLSGIGLPGDSISDCLVHVAQVLSVSNGNLDTDGDALRDGWEANGYDHDSDGSVDVALPAMGANPFHKDVFLEIDWMSESGDDHHRPDDIVVNRLINAFKQSNATNPDVSTGIMLHIDRSNAIDHTDFLVNDWNQDALFSEMESIKAANMEAARYVTHHYQLWVHSLWPDNPDTPTDEASISGIAQSIPGDDSIVSLGAWGAPQGTDDERTGTSMHELGHTLNLRHGYPYTVDNCTPGGNPNNGCGDDAFMPNHLSVMSYIYQTVGLIKNGRYGTWDYQRWALNQLDENCLMENDGVGFVPALDVYGLRWYRYTNFILGTVLTEDKTNGAANGPIDWNQDGKINNVCVRRSINSGNAGDDTDREILNATKNEWRLLVFCGGAVGTGTCLDSELMEVRVFEINLLTDHELTYEESRRLQNNP